MEKKTEKRAKMNAEKKMEKPMETRHCAAAASGQARSLVAMRPTDAFEQQCLRMLRCTARAWANSPAGLGFTAGTRPWLDALCERRGSLTVPVPIGGRS